MIGLETPINIDLRELTPEILNICEPHLGKGEYDAPCLIGALMNVDDRSYVASLAEADRIAEETPFDWEEGEVVDTKGWDYGEIEGPEKLSK